MTLRKVDNDTANVTSPGSHSTVGNSLQLDQRGSTRQLLTPADCRGEPKYCSVVYAHFVKLFVSIVHRSAAWQKSL